MSEIVTIEPPRDRVVTLEEARQQLRLDGRDEDLLLGAKLEFLQFIDDIQFLPCSTNNNLAVGESHLL
jgi:hypothetical protein